MDKDTVIIPVAFLTELLNIRKQHFIVCEEFKIPIERRGEEWVGQGILERLHTYLSAYIIKRSITERENGAAFTSVLQPKISDPTLLQDEKKS